MGAADKQYLEENAKQEGVIVTESGLQYRVLEAGSGKSPADSNAEVEVHYEGKLVNGKVFDSSYKRGQSITFFLNQVIPGWSEGVQLMQEGATFEFTIPSELGYGTRGAQGVIPPNATLIFKVELLKVY